jgi:hypothetical protein
MMRGLFNRIMALLMNRIHRMLLAFLNQTMTICIVVSLFFTASRDAFEVLQIRSLTMNSATNPELRHTPLKDAGAADQIPNHELCHQP